MTACHLSVCMCTYNGAQYLDEQLQSIAAQTLQPDEMVICDDQSHDQTVEIIKTFSATASFPVRWDLNPQRLGVTKNFEKAISLSKGNIILLADQDDIWLPGKIKQINKQFEENPQSGFVFSDAIVVDQELHDLKYLLWSAMRFKKKQQKQWKKGKAFEVLLHSKVVTGATMAFRSSFKKLILPIPSCWNHDAWIALIIAAVADSVPLEPPLIQYRQHAGNQIGARKVSFIEECGNTIKKIRAGDKQVSENYLLTAKQFSLAEKHLRLHVGNSLGRERSNILQQRIRHSLFRAQLSSIRAKRFWDVIMEYTLLRYCKFSDGWKSALKDILLDK